MDWEVLMTKQQHVATNYSTDSMPLTGGFQEADSAHLLNFGIDFGISEHSNQSKISVNINSAYE